MQSKAQQPQATESAKRSTPRSLAPLRKHRPDAVVPREGTDPVAQLILVLALVFNDLKGLMSWREQIYASQPSSSSEVSTEVGEWSGFDIQNYRLMAAQLHEFLRLISEFQAVLNDDQMRRILRKAPASVRDDWEDVISVATGTGNPRDKSFATTLTQIRNDAAYHYYQPKRLVRGYRTHFFEASPTPENEVAYASIGTTMARTRFYFADAAMKATLGLITGGGKKRKRFDRQMDKAVNTVNEALHHIVSEYLKRASVP